MARTGFYNAVYLDQRQMKSIMTSLDKIRSEFSDTKTKQVARKAAKPLRTEMKSLAPKNKNKPKYRYYMGDRYKYKAGTLKRSVAIFSGKKGIFVAPRIGRMTRSVLGKPNLDGFYAHFVINRGGAGADFVEKARLNKRVEVLNKIEKEAKNIIKW